MPFNNRNRAIHNKFMHLKTIRFEGRLLVFNSPKN